jgi:hypothetical protein
VTGEDPSEYFRPSDINEAVESKLLCARDNKWRLVSDAIQRLECDCYTQFTAIVAVYRLWKCTGSQPLDNLGLASIEAPYKGDRDFWFRWARRLMPCCSVWVQALKSMPVACVCGAVGSLGEASSASSRTRPTC